MEYLGQALRYGAVLAMAAATVLPAMADELPYKPIAVTTPDGVHISAQEWGNPTGPEIVFIHGYAQSHLSWLRQVTAPELSGYRMITYDMRGHGDSDKPAEREKYQSPKLWADELKAVMDAAGLKHPVVVPWSWAGRVACYYLMNYGSDRLAGIDFVDATTNTDPKYLGPGVIVGLASKDLATNIKATVALLHETFYQQPSDADLQTMVAYNMVMPTQVRINMGGLKLDATESFKQLHLPVLVTYGEHDRIVLPSLSQFTASTIPGAKLSMIPAAGHAPFWEQSALYNRQLLDFMASLPK